MRVDKETVSTETEQKAAPRVEASPRLGQRPHRPPLISPGIALCLGSSVPTKGNEVPSRPGEDEFRCHLDAGLESGKGTTKTVSELVAFSDCLACCPAASSISCFRTSWSARST